MKPNIHDDTVMRIEKTIGKPVSRSMDAAINECIDELDALKADITKLFGTNKAIFQISIKDNKIIIESPKILANLDNQDRQLQEEAINV